ncbi:MAG TPA: diguanylate cyclase [Acidimicrobiales bacterium]|nr:diguanylate cyclase [Acidimicrobiales bacterium]
MGHAEGDGPRERPALARRGGRRFLPLSIRTSLVALALVPLAASVGLAATIVVHESAIHNQAEVDNRTTLELDSLLRARAALTAEYLDSVEVVVGQSFHLSVAQVSALLGVDVQAHLAAARRSEDRQPVFAPGGLLHGRYAQLVDLRQSVDRGATTVAPVEAFFNGLKAAINARWLLAFDRLSTESAATASPGTEDRLTALGRSFAASTAGLAEDPLVEAVLTTTAPPAEVQDLIVARQAYQTAVQGFPQGLGPKATTAWGTVAHNPLTTEFDHAAALAVTVGLGHETPPYATNVPAVAVLGKSEAYLVTAMTNLVVTGSADLRTATTSQAGSATRALELTYVLMALLILAEVAVAVSLGRAIRRPLARIAAAAQSIRAGEFELPELSESGPKEVAVASAAFNEMSSTLMAVQSQTVALANGDFDSPVLLGPLPGRTGAALQSALNELQLSVRMREAQRAFLQEQATRDPLTGLLNRGAGLEALQLDLARVHRSDGELVLAILFVDLDELKKINDTFGHDSGDKAILAVADALRANTRASDVVARFGGDEFVVGWLGASGSDSPALLAGRIRDGVSSSDIQSDGRTITLGCSIGGAMSEPGDSTIQTLIGRADDALYVAKASGRHQVSWAGSA